VWEEHGPISAGTPRSELFLICYLHAASDSFKEYSIIQKDFVTAQDA
jgi:hypothetical protein